MEKSDLPVAQARQVFCAGDADPIIIKIELAVFQTAAVVFHQHKRKLPVQKIADQILWHFPCRHQKQAVHALSLRAVSQHLERLFLSPYGAQTDLKLISCLAGAVIQRLNHGEQMKPGRV